MNTLLLLALCPPLAAFAQPASQGATPVNAPVVHEKYEWSNIWGDCADDPALPRVLLIGDSISCGYSGVVNRILEGKYHVDRLGTSRSINDPVLLKETAMMLEDCKYAVVHINNGLHGFHLTGEQYAAALKDYLALIKAHCGDAKLVWCASTPITKNGDPATLDASNEKVTTRNALALEIAQAQGIPVDDLYQVVIGKADLRSGDGYHYNDQGYEALGKAVADAVLKAAQ